MPSTSKRKTSYATIFFIGIAFLFFSSPKTLSAYTSTNQTLTNDFIGSLVSGYITNQEDIPEENCEIRSVSYPAIVSCDTSSDEFVNYTINGVSVSISPASGGNLILSLDSMYSNSQLIEASGGVNGADLYFRFNNQNIAIGSTQTLYHVMNGVMGLPLMPSTSIAVNITEYGSVGEYISGNFTGTVFNFNPPNTPYVITCSFRVKRQF